MASEIDFMRMLLGDPDPAPAGTTRFFSNDQIVMLRRNTESFERAAEYGWSAKAAFYANLVDINESGAERFLSQMHKNAIRQIQQYHIAAETAFNALNKSVKPFPAAIGSPWGVQRISNVNWPSTWIIGDASRGPSGLIIFIETPVPVGGAEVFSEDEVVALVPITTHSVPDDRPFNLNVEKGRTFDFKFFYKPQGSLVDLSGWSAQLLVRPVGNPGGSALLTLTSGGGTIIIAGGAFDIHLTPAQTAALAFTQGEYELVATDPNFDQFRLVGGLFIVTIGDV